MLSNKRWTLLFLPAILLLLAAACGNGEGDQEAWIEEHGYGPVNEPVDIGELNAELASEGRTIFNTYCTACHAMDSSISGPALRPVAGSRTPEFIMNYILNPTENRENHPVGQQLGEQYTMRMVNMGLDTDQARAIYEYMRYYNEHREDPPAD